MKIVIWTGPAWETWGPRSIIEGGIGGSETAAIHMATQLSDMGHKVTIIGQVVEGIFNNVRYVHCRDWKAFPAEALECDVFISSRDRSIVRQVKPRAKLTILWMHDLHMGEDIMEEMIEYDRIFVLSKYALEYALACYPHVAKEKYVVTRNGIDPKLFLRPRETIETAWSVEKVGCKAIYSSSYDRGLDRLLTFWPKVRKICPEAELHIYYGFDTAEKQVASMGSATANMALNFFKSRLSDMSNEGVTSHGRVGQQVLAEAFLESSLWLYPTNFHETSCITAMEAQAAGAYAITSNLAALPETLQTGHLIEPPNTTDDYEEEFLDGIQWYLDERDHYIGPHLRLTRKWALEQLSWYGVAIDWNRKFANWMNGDHRA